MARDWQSDFEQLVNEHQSMVFHPLRPINSEISSGAA
jgi:hypothetical protein